MRAVLKILGLILGLMAILLMAGAAYLMLYFDPNDYKPQLAEFVKRHTGRELRVAGNIELSFCPALGVDVSGIRFSNAPGFGPEPFAEIDSLAVRVKTAPLFRGKVEIRQLTVAGVRLHLAEDQDGHTNWADLRQAGSAQDNAHAGLPGSGLDLHHLRIDGVQIVYDNRSTGLRVETSKFHLSDKTLRGSQPLEFTAAVALPRQQSVMTGTLDLSGIIATNFRAQWLTFRDTVLRVALAGPALPPAGIQGDLQMTGQVDLASQSITVSELIARVLGLKAKGQFRVDTVVDNPYLTGALVLQTYKPHELLSLLGSTQHLPQLDGTLGFSGALIADFKTQHYMLRRAQIAGEITGPHLPPAGIRGDMTLAIEIDMTQQRAVVNELTVRVLELELEGAGTVEGLTDQLRYEGTLAARTFSPRELLAALGVSPPPTRDQSVLTAAALELTLTGNATSLTVQPISGYFDETHLHGRIAVKNFVAPAIRFDLELDALNVDRYRPPATDPTARPDAKTSATDLPREKLPDLDLVGDMRIGKFTLNRQQTTDVVIKVNWDP